MCFLNAEIAEYTEKKLVSSPPTPPAIRMVIKTKELQKGQFGIA